MNTQKLKFSVDINAPKENVWKVLWDDETYRKWTSAFKEGSYAVGNWNEGSKVLFLGPEGEGMYSTVAKNTPNEFMSFRHVGVVRDGKEQPLDEETKKWSGSLENYTLTENKGITTLIVEVDVTDEFKDYMNETFPKALNKVKEVAEKKHGCLIEVVSVF